MNRNRPDFTEERRTRVLEIVNTRGRIRAIELAELLEVAVPTVRKDIADLDRQHKLRRTHGGALALRPYYEFDYDSRADKNRAAKQAIARACIELLSDSDSIFLDSGTTIGYIAEQLRLDNNTEPTGRNSTSGVPRNLTVLTNSPGVAQSVAEIPSLRHTVLGGQYRPVGRSYVGSLALEAVRQFTVNTAFIGVTGLAGEDFSVADLAEAELKRAVIERARRVIVPMDNSKIGSQDFVKVCGLDSVDAIVTDGADEYLRGTCSENSVELIVAPVEE